MSASSGLLDCDVKAEGFKLADMTTNSALGVTPVEVVGPESVAASRSADGGRPAPRLTVCTIVHTVLA